VGVPRASSKEFPVGFFYRVVVTFDVRDHCSREIESFFVIKRQNHGATSCRQHFIRTPVFSLSLQLHCGINMGE
jgi:hypothetical protein